MVGTVASYATNEFLESADVLGHVAATRLHYLLLMYACPRSEPALESQNPSFAGVARSRNYHTRVNREADMLASISL